MLNAALSLTFALPLVTGIQTTIYGVTQDLIPGQGVAAKSGSQVAIQFSVSTLDGKTLANSATRGLEYRFVLGSEGADPVLSTAVRGLAPGGERNIFTESALLYGEKGRVPFVPPGLVLQVKVRVLEVDGARVPLTSN
jgi:FKBP-type peptidyl-prolyl cis-trans isomerase